MNFYSHSLALPSPFLDLGLPHCVEEEGHDPIGQWMVSGAFWSPYSCTSTALRTCTFGPNRGVPSFSIWFTDLQD